MVFNSSGQVLTWVRHSCIIPGSNTTGGDSWPAYGRSVALVLVRVLTLDVTSHCEPPREPPIAMGAGNADPLVETAYVRAKVVLMPVNFVAVLANNATLWEKERLRITFVQSSNF